MRISKIALGLNSNIVLKRISKISLEIIKKLLFRFYKKFSIHKNVNL